MAVEHDDDDDDDELAYSSGAELNARFVGMVAHDQRPTPAITNGPFGPEERIKTTYRHPLTGITTRIPTENREPPKPDRLAQPMPKSALQPLRRTGPLNLNDDGTDISYRKSHARPNARHCIQSYAEEMERLFTSGTIRPLHFSDIPADTVVTYVNRVCSEKLNDDAETLKLRTCITIGRERIDYSYDKAAVTANMEALKPHFPTPSTSASRVP
jgi:hypothetical protein